MEQFSTVVALDVHKDSIDISTADEFGGRESRHYGKIGGDMGSLDRTVRKLRSSGAKLRFVYEAGPCGYEIYRHLTGQGFECAVIAPSMTPMQSGNRIKTDKRDSMMLARLHRAGELTAVYVPLEDDEAMRDLTRAREDAVKGLRVARQHVGAMLLRLGIRLAGKKTWSPAYMRRLADLKMPTPTQQLVFQEYINAVRECTGRVERLTGQVAELVPAWRMAPLVMALQAMRGVALIVAATFVAEIGDPARFNNPRQLMAYLGLVPSEHSSGQSVFRGGITKTGNGHVRRALVEAAQAYSLPAKVSRVILGRQDGLPQAVLDIAWKAQVRLCGKFRRLTTKGKPRNKAVTAVARELSGFMWDVARIVRPSAA